MRVWRIDSLSGFAALTLSCLVFLGSAIGCRTVEPRGADTSQPVSTGPYIVLDGPGRAYIGLKTHGATPVVEWWEAPETLEGTEVLEELEEDAEVELDVATPPRTAPSASTDVHQVTGILDKDVFVASLRGLPESGLVGYRVRVGDEVTDEQFFRTGANRAARFRFVAFGDTRTRPTVHQAVVEAAARENPSFVIHTGDMVARGGVKAQWDRFFRIEQPLLSKAPIFPSIGNHDLGRRQYYERYFLLDRTTRGRRYYHYDYGDLRLVALDGDIEGRRGSRQYAFVERALIEAAERDMLTIIFLHWPPYSSGRHGSQLAIRAAIGKLARDYGVELVISGHDHIYERTVPIDGTTYVVSGSAGAPTRNVDSQWFTAHARTEPHFVVVDVEDKTMTVRAVNLDGNVFDSTVVTANPPRVALTRSGR